MYETLAGLIIHSHENIALKNEQIFIENFIFTIIQASKTKIEQVNLKISEL
jgi:Mg2+/Co2+ transporter CorB